MDYITTSVIFEAIERTSPPDLKDQFYQAAVKYAHVRAEYYMANREVKKEMKVVLTQSENDLVDAWQGLSEHVHALLSKDTGWREIVCDDRERIRNFACYLHFIMSVLAVQ